DNPSTSILSSSVVSLELSLPLFLIFLTLLSFLPLRPPPRSPLFPYTTLFRSSIDQSSAESAASDAELGPIDIIVIAYPADAPMRSEEHTSELQSLTNLVCRLLLEKKRIDQRCMPMHMTTLSH